MKKKTYTATNLACVLQHSEEIPNGQCLTGVISRTSDGFRFEEAIRKGRPPRNPKLFDGKFISMVKMQNGRYQCHLKTMGENFDRQNFAFSVYSELNSAMAILD